MRNDGGAATCSHFEVMLCISCNEQNFRLLHITYHTNGFLNLSNNQCLYTLLCGTRKIGI
jgi:hypothetical protein